MHPIRRERLLDLRKNLSIKVGKRRVDLKGLKENLRLLKNKI
jgi:hypothetical protein